MQFGLGVKLATEGQLASILFNFYIIDVIAILFSTLSVIIRFDSNLAFLSTILPSTLLIAHLLLHAFLSTPHHVWNGQARYQSNDEGNDQNPEDDFDDTAKR
jgi:hypothetical protein